VSRRRISDIWNCVTARGMLEWDAGASRVLGDVVFGFQQSASYMYVLQFKNVLPAVQS
jgi:hypothetical protein